MANVGTAAAGKTLIGAGNGASPTYVDIGTNSGLTSRGVVIAEGNGAFQATTSGSVGQVLQSGGASANPSYSSATYPSTTTINQLLYSSSANVVSGLSTVNSAALVTNSSGVPTWSSTMTNGQIIIGSTGGTPVAASLTAGTGITITPGAGSISIASTATGGATDFITDSGTAVESSGDINILGGTGLSSSGSGNTVTINLDTPVAVTSGGTGLSTATSGDLLYASASNTYSALSIGALGCTMISNGSIPVWLNPRSGFVLHDDWMSATFAGDLGWGRAIVGTGSNAITNDAFLGHPGVLYLSTGTDATGRAMLITLDDCIVLGDGQYQVEWLIRIEDLATVAEDYTIRVGFGDTTGSGDWTYGVYFEYTRATSANWLIKTADNGTRTSTTTSTAVTEDTWIRLTINVNAAATLCTYYVNGSSVGTINTNIPDGGTGTDGIGPDIGIIKTAGNTNRNLYVDYCTIVCLLTNTR